MNVMTCRFCGSQGIEEADDPAPGVCPHCLDRRMAAATAKLTPSTTIAQARKLLIDVGLTPRAANAFLSSAISAMLNHEQPRQPYTHRCPRGCPPPPGPDFYHELCGTCLDEVFDDWSREAERAR